MKKEILKYYVRKIIGKIIGGCDVIRLGSFSNITRYMNSLIYFWDFIANNHYHGNMVKSLTGSSFGFGN